MADDRPLEDPTDKIGRLQSELDDLKSTLLARLTRRPTGDVETTIRSTPKANTLILNGQVVARGDYPDLWAWAQEQGLVVAGLFTVGNGTTTFGLPDFRGRVARGVAAAESVGALLGADSRSLTVANLPAHDHNVGINAVGDHGHGFTTGSAGGHGAHNSGIHTVSNGAGNTYDLPTGFNDNLGSHSHSGGVDLSGNHTHAVNESTVGSGTALDLRQASVAVNWLIWT